MEEIKEDVLRPPKNFKEVKLEMSLGELNPSQADGVHIQCVNSSEFVVGKQTSFNAPVTIINYSEGNPKPQSPLPARENIVIRDRVLSKSAAKMIREMARDPGEKHEPSLPKKKFWELWHESLAKRQCNKTFVVSIILFLGLTLAVAISLAALNTKPQLPERTKAFFINDTANGSLVYTKEDWGGEPATSFTKLQLPVPFVIISHSATPQCFDLGTCSILLYNMQSYVFSKDLADLTYNFLVDSSGNVYEGRGWNLASSLSPPIYTKSIVLNFIGDYSRDKVPSRKQQEAVKALIAYGVENDKISKNYFLISANATFPTLSPGKQVYEIIQYWPRFQPDYRLLLNKNE